MWNQWERRNINSQLSMRMSSLSFGQGNMARHHRGGWIERRLSLFYAPENMAPHHRRSDTLILYFMCFKSSILRKLGNPKMRKQEQKTGVNSQRDCNQEVVRVHTEKLERTSKSVTVPKLILPPRKRSQSMSGKDTSSNCSGVSEIQCKDDLFIHFGSF